MNNLNKRCANIRQFAHPTLAEVLNHKRGLSLTMVKRLHKGLIIPYESLLSAPKSEKLGNKLDKWCANYLTGFARPTLANTKAFVPPALARRKIKNGIRE